MNEATYCPEDNKLRLYCGRVPRDEYEALRAVGYKPTPKQDCDFVATWSLAAEDAALAMLDDGDDIGDEDQSPEDRAADRAERFAMYRDKRRSEAGGHADTFDAGPAAHGYQDERKAQRAANRHGRERTRALSQWSKAEYWQDRTAGVISHALYTTSAHVRRGRILRIESDLIDLEKRLPRFLCCTVSGAKAHRIADHLRARLAYERQMIEASGGSADALEIVPGGMFGGYVVLGVNKSRKTGRAVSVSVMAPKPWHNGEGPAPLTRQSLNIQRLGESAYKPPTPESLEELARLKANAKAATQAKNAKKPQLINPTNEDAQRLQDHLNAHADAEARSEYSKPEPQTVREMTQAEWSRASRGTYSHYETMHLLDDGTVLRDTNMWCKRSNQPKLCKLRIAPSQRSQGSGFYSAYRVVVLTDKPTKPLPEWNTQTEAAQS
jgi:hypothetical protein